MMNRQCQNTRWQRFLAEMRSTYKSMDTEEKWDIWVVRPIGFVEAWICRWLHIHPNAITIVSILFGAASGYFFFPGQTFSFDRAAHFEGRRLRRGLLQRNRAAAL